MGLSSQKYYMGEYRSLKASQPFDFNLVTNLTVPGDQVSIIWQLGWEKKLSKYIKMGFSFEDLVATKPTVKTDVDLELRFKR